jgi:putative ABC transport system permease protein
MDTLPQDIRYAARKLVRTPGFTLIAVATLALAIGATTAAFSIVNGVLLKPLPFREPDRVVVVGSTNLERKLQSMSAPDFIDYRDRTHSFVGMAAVQAGNSANLSVSGATPVRLNSAAVGARFFELLGVSMRLGRGFLANEDAAGAERVAVLSEKLWRNTFAGDPAVLGRVISLNGQDYKVIGVAPSSLTYPRLPDLWTPFKFESWMTDPENRGAHFLGAIGRIKPGVSFDVAKRDMMTIGEQLRAQYPRSNTNFGGSIEEIQTNLVGDVSKMLFTLLGATGFVLLIACANVANLLLVRASGRETEMAVRTALGAGRGRIIRQLITESVMLSAIGALIGAALASWSVDAIVAFGPRGLPRLDNVTVDGRVLVFCAGLALLTGVVFGLVPAIHSARAELGQMLKDAVRGSSSKRGARRTRNALVVTEMALAVVLLVGAGLLIRSLANLVRVNPGFRPEHLVSFDVSLPSTKYPNDRDVRAFTSSVRDRLSALPGTQSVAVAFSRPMEPHGMRTDFNVDGQPPAPENKRMLTDVHPVTWNFFASMGIPVLRGRAFAPAEENFGVPQVVVVSESFAKKFFPNENAIGKRITLGIDHDTAANVKSNVTARGEIIGIVGDVKQRGLASEVLPTTYVGWGTFPISDMAVLVRSTADVATLSAAIRENVRAIDPAMPVYELQTMEDAVSESVSQPRFYTTLLTAFGGLALLLAALGIYGVISYSVAQRTRELGIRIALGATHDRVLRLVLGQGVGLSVLGVAIGIAGALWLVHLLSTLLYGVQTTDKLTFASVAALLVGIASLASYLPARRAARVDPVIAMRAD